MLARDAVRIDSHAEATLRYIRASMDAAASVAVPGSSAMTAGAVGLAATLLSSLPSLAEHWLIIWPLAACVAGCIGGVLLLRNSSPDVWTIRGSPFRKFALAFLPSIAAGAVLTVVLWRYGNVQLIPGTWLVLYGCALIAASVATVQIMSFIGAGFFMFGAIALFAPAALQMALLGLGFGGLHLLLGYMIGRTERAG